MDLLSFPQRPFSISFAETHIKHLFPLPTLLTKDRGQKLCEIMSLLSEQLCPPCSETTFAMPGFMCRRYRRALEGRQGISPIRPLSSPGCHKPLISHSPRRAGLTPTAYTPLCYPPPKKKRTLVTRSSAWLYVGIQGSGTEV